MAYGKKANALRDGYTCEAKRPKTAAPGVFMSEEKADSFDEQSNSIARWGGRDALLRRRFQDVPQNTIPPDDEDDLGYFF